MPAAPHEVTFADGDRELVVAYAFDRANRLVTLQVDGEEIEGAVLHDAAPDHVDLEAGGHRRRFAVHAEPGGAVHVNCDAGQLSLVEQPRHPQIEDVAAAGSLASPMPGSVWKVLAAAGDDVRRASRC